MALKSSYHLYCIVKVKFWHTFCAHFLDYTDQKHKPLMVLET